MKYATNRDFRRGFTLVELLVVIAIIAILAAVLFPVLARAQLKGKITRVHSDLRQIAIAIQMYNDDWGGLPPVRSTCSGTSVWDYYEVPKELHELNYLSISKMYDPFNETRGDDGKELRAYKYIAINWGYSMGNIAYFTMWIPRDYPECNQDCIMYYKYAGAIYAYDKGKTYPKNPPIMWAVWSVGPEGDPGLQGTGNRQLPVPRKEWYPFNKSGIIARFSDGMSTP